MTIEQISRSTKSASVPNSLRHIYVCVTFHWEVQSLIFLRQVTVHPSPHVLLLLSIALVFGEHVLNCFHMQVLSTMQRYPTKVDYCVLTNRPERLKLAIMPWASPKVVCGTQKNLSHPFKLAWEHRAYMKQAFQRKNPGKTTALSGTLSNSASGCLRVQDKLSRFQDEQKMVKFWSSLVVLLLTKHMS